jgi:hypothetical protein
MDDRFFIEGKGFSIRIHDPKEGLDNKFFIKSSKVSVRIHKPDQDSFTFNKPNPRWKVLGDAWLNVALNKEHLEKQKSRILDVAYLPSSHLGITRGNKEDNVLPAKRDLHKFPNSSNFVIMTKNGFFRIQGSYLACDGGYIGSKKNVEFDPVTERDTILALLRIAKKIHSPLDKGKPLGE